MAGLNVLKVERIAAQAGSYSFVFGCELGGKPAGIRIVAKLANASTAHFSRPDGGRWQCDAVFAPNGRALWSHGTLSVFSQVVDPSELVGIVAELDAHASRFAADGVV